ncbi:hypothetical protein ACFTXM_09735 [Streptomyces sp. NPDC056930]|uniref:hypothetical protein n=1 Tax=Streptomyces sp. NPDC056930 TaxID=3345967 RepID=UPI003640A5B3
MSNEHDALIRQALLRLEDARDRLEVASATRDVPDDVFSALTGLIADVTLLMPVTLACYRCGRKYRADEHDQLERTTDGQFKCSPDGPNHAQCMRALGLSPTA